MTIELDEVMMRTNELYAKYKERVTLIESDQVKALAAILVATFNEELDDIREDAKNNYECIRQILMGGSGD